MKTGPKALVHVMDFSHSLKRTDIQMNRQTNKDITSSEDNLPATNS